MEQRDAICRYASRFNLTIIEWFEEQQTAAKKGRPIWNRMLKSLQRSKAEGVVMHKIDRSARNLKDWSDLSDIIDQGVEVHFANESLDMHSRGGRLSADIQAVVAADYIRNLRDETKKGIYGRLKQGFYPLRAPIGYLDHGAAKPKTIDPAKGPLVRKGFELYASGRFTIHSLGDELFRLGLRNHSAGRVTRNGISTILNNSFYMGVIHIRKTNSNFMGNHEPLISKRLFETVQDVLHGRLNPRTRKHEFLFRRLLNCKLCGYALIGETKKGHVYYRCHTSDCPTMGIREERINDFIEESLKKIQFSEAELSYLRNATEQLKHRWIEEKDQQIAALNLTLQQVAERVSRLTDAYIDGALDRELFEERKKGLLFERRSVEDQITFLKTNPNAVPVILQKFLELAGTAFFLYSVASPARKRHLVKIVTSNLTLEQKTLGFPYSEPFREVATRETAHGCTPRGDMTRTCDALIASLLPKVEQYRPLLEAYEEEGASE